MNQLIVFLFLATAFIGGGCFTESEDHTCVPPKNLTGICQRQANLYAPDHTYIKSVCQTFDDLSYQDAVKHCREHNMELFNINDSRTEAELYSFADTKWRRYFGAALWVNGKFEKDGWYTYSPYKEPLYRGLTWYTDYPDSDGPYGDYLSDDLMHTDKECLRTSNIRGDFMVDGYNCERAMSAFCEYFCVDGMEASYTTEGTETMEETSKGSKVNMFCILKVLLGMLMLMFLSKRRL